MQPPNQINHRMGTIIMLQNVTQRQEIVFKKDKARLHVISKSISNDIMLKLALYHSQQVTLSVMGMTRLRLRLNNHYCNNNVRKKNKPPKCRLSSLYKFTTLSCKNNRAPKSQGGHPTFLNFEKFKFKV